MNRRSLNGSAGQTGSLGTTTITGNLTLSETHGGRVLEVDPAGGAVTLALPFDQIGPGFFVEVVQVSAGTVSFAAEPGATIVSTSGAAPSLSGQWSAAVVRRRDGDGQWIVGGGIA